ncbi:MAG TPA: ABC transporter ATP-binding protein, partial [bacterium]|nr:ABC transporter ATP-binding protein [bacterium]
MIPNIKVRLFRRVLRHGRLLGLVLLFTVLYALVSGLSLGMILPFVDLLFSQGSPTPAPPDGAGPLELLRFDVQARAAEWFFHGEPRAALQRICAFLLAAFALKGLVGFFLAFHSVALEERILKDLRDDLFTHLQTLSMGWFAGRRAGDLMSRATNDVAVVRKAVSSMYRTLPREILLVAVYLSIVFLASWRLALLCLVVFPLLAVSIGVIGRKIRRQSSRAQARMADLSSVFQETITGIRVVKAFGGEKFSAGRFLQQSGAYLSSILRLRRVASLAGPFAELTGALGAVVVLWAGGNQVLAGEGLSSTWFVIFLAAMISLMQPVRALSQIHTHLEEGDAAARRIFEILDARPSVAEAVDPRPLPGLQREIVFEDVTFEYDADVPVLHDVSLRIPKGEVVALVGPSGAGKSTLADMLARFHDPDRGRVMIDGEDLRNVRIDDLRALLGIVTQETILFHDTIESNIAYADPRPDRERVVAAAKAANAHEFIERAPQGYDTVLGDRGLRVSGGERQRLSIARAIYRNPQILIFDEATSSLDSESEAKVQEAIDRLMEGRTAVVIAHRLSTVRHADRIVVLDRGRVVETGPHAELIARG